MKSFTITYQSYEGNIRTMEIEAEDEDSARFAAFEGEGLYGGDDIHKIIEVQEN